jgi:hypothetical protein
MYIMNIIGREGTIERLSLASDFVAANSFGCGGYDTNVRRRDGHHRGGMRGHSRLAEDRKRPPPHTVDVTNRKSGTENIL